MYSHMIKIYPREAVIITTPPLEKELNEARGGVA